ncbi:MAG: hypothetical protein MZV70_65900 [Desulfobacterales bacterium]|nr:hypothetical protein [Desulfobacterales bacterium]
MRHDFTPSFLRIPEAGAASCTVTTTDDTGPGTLRHCIAIANGTRGTTIDFGIKTSPNAQDEQGNAWWRIEVLSPLPTITADDTVLEGTTQPGDMNAKGPEIEIYGGSAAGADGLTVSDAHSVTIRGLVLSGFRSAAAVGGTGILITGADAANNRVEGNYVGTDATGTIGIRKRQRHCRQGGRLRKQDRRNRRGRRQRHIGQQARGIMGHRHDGHHRPGELHRHESGKRFYSERTGRHPAAECTGKRHRRGPCRGTQRRSRQEIHVGMPQVAGHGPGYDGQ